MRSFDESKVKRGRGDKGGQFVDKDGIPNNKPSKSPERDAAEQSKHGGLYFDRTKKQWLDKSGKPVDAKTIERLKEIGATAGYVEVSLNPDPKSPLKAWVLQADGNYKRLYSKAHQTGATAEKFSRLKDFDKSLPKIRSGIEQSMLNKGASIRQRDTAAALRLVEKTGIRPGSDDGESVIRDKKTGEAKAQKTYGATSLEGQHIKLGPNGRVDLMFLGKSGKTNTRSFVDPQLSKYLSQKNLVKGQPIFDTDPGYANAMLKTVSGKNFKVKDFRTWQGTSIALKEVNRMGHPRNEAEYKKMRELVATKVSDFLNNSPAVALAHYIDPHVFVRWGGGKP